MKKLIILPLLLLSFAGLTETLKPTLNDVLKLNKYKGQDLSLIQFVNEELKEAGNRSTVCFADEIYSELLIKNRIEFYCNDIVMNQLDALSEHGYFLEGQDDLDLYTERSQTICRLYKSIDICG